MHAAATCHMLACVVDLVEVDVAHLRSHSWSHIQWDVCRCHLGKCGGHTHLQQAVLLGTQKSHIFRKQSISHCKYILIKAFVDYVSVLGRQLMIGIKSHVKQLNGLQWQGCGLYWCARQSA